MSRLHSTSICVQKVALYWNGTPSHPKWNSEGVPSALSSIRPVCCLWYHRPYNSIRPLKVNFWSIWKGFDVVQVVLERSVSICEGWIWNFSPQSFKIWGSTRFGFGSYPFFFINLTFGKHHIYADDTQIYCHITPTNAKSAFNTLDQCLSDIQAWMDVNKLKLILPRLSL